MKRFAANSECVLTYDLQENFVDTATKVNWELFNTKGENVDKGEVQIDPTAESKVVSIKIKQEDNIVASDTLLDYRRIKLYISTSEGTNIDTIEYYLVGNNVALVPMRNSYQTFGEAQVLAATISGLQEWQIVPPEDKTSALITAFHKIGKLNFMVQDTEISDLNKLTVEEFESLDSNFVNDIKRAQIIEANAISGYNAAEQMKRSNILSYTIGETSQMFKTGNTYVSNLSSDAMDVLEGYIYRKILIARA